MGLIKSIKDWWNGLPDGDSADAPGLHHNHVPERDDHRLPDTDQTVAGARPDDPAGEREGATSMSIDQTIRESVSLPYGAESYVAPVVTALVERERGIAERIIEFAGERGLPTEQAKDVLRGLGMEVTPDPEPEPVVEEPVAAGSEAVTVGGETTDVVALLNEIRDGQRQQNDAIAGLTQFARRHGYAG